MQSPRQLRLVVTLLFSALSSLSQPDSVSGEERPNVLLILVDDLKPTLGCYGDPVARTPNIDSLAARGMRFDLAYCNQAVCAPSRFTLMLGAHSTSTGLYGLGSQLRQIVPDAVTMPQHFAKHGGYRTESLGKVFHIGHGNHGDPDSFSIPHFHDKVIEYLDPASTEGGKLTREEAYFTNQKLGEIKSLPRGAAYESPDVSDGQYADGRVAEETVRRLQAARERRSKDGTPFFITAGFARPHLPFSAPKKYWDLYDPATLPMPEFEDLPKDAPAVAGKRGGEISNYSPVPTDRDELFSTELKRKLVHGYYASTSFVDAQIGKVIDALDRLELADNTIIVLWGDHGFHLGDLGIWTKHTNYEQANRIPILISAPGVTKPNSSSRQPAESVDIFPTLAQLAGLPAPEGPQPIDGKSLVPVLKDPDKRVRDHAYHAYPKQKLGRAIRTERYRLVEWKRVGESPESAEYELYDYEIDPLESRNLASEKPDVVAALKKTLAEYPQPATRSRRAPKKKAQNAAIEKPALRQIPIVDEWRYTLRRPAEGWRQDDFDDADWKEGAGGFGIRSTPGSRVGTTWASNSIWLRKTLEVNHLPANPALLIHHDENAEVYINGTNVSVLKGFTTEYKVVPIPEPQRRSIKVGRNVMAVHCAQTVGGQFIDVHLIDADNVPKLPEPKRGTTPFISELITKWGEQVTPENAWTEYPRPRLERDQWVNLNGQWDYAITAIEQTDTPSKWSGKILVPYALESKLSGVQRLLDPSEALWYRRTFHAKKTDGRRLLLNFEAVDYRCEVFVNDQSVGTHVGGNTPFSFEITDAIKEGDNELVVRVEDATEEWQLRGKQVLNPRGIWYTQVSGIWQTVWLEDVPEKYIADIVIKPGPKTGSLIVHPIIHGSGKAVLRFKDGDETVYTLSTNQKVTIEINEPKLWSPSSPFLYDIDATLFVAGEEVDHVSSYVGIRTVGKVKDADGHWRFTLNGEPIFHWGPLDQGWWPDGLLTPPSDEAMLFDIEWLKQAGFNMIRKHIKVEPRRYYYHCDRLGMMVWQDQVSGGKGRNNGWPQWTRLKPDPVDARWPPKQHKQFMAELDEMISSLESHPSIVSWVPFNEAWGQHRTTEVGEWTSTRDPSRLINVASGGNFWPVGDIVDEHRYPHPGFPFELNGNGRFDDFIKVMGEFGGHGYPVKGHLWDANRRNWGYGGLPQNEAEYKDRYVTSLILLNELRGQGIAGGVYTQTTDVEGEINGLMTYDRKVIKIPAKILAELHQALFKPVSRQ